VGSSPAGRASYPRKPEKRVRVCSAQSIFSTPLLFAPFSPAQGEKGVFYGCHAFSGKSLSLCLSCLDHKYKRVKAKKCYVFCLVHLADVLGSGCGFHRLSWHIGQAQFHCCKVRQLASKIHILHPFFVQAQAIFFARAWESVWTP
jgi:hypothetical protein